MLDVYLYHRHVATLIDAGDGELALQYTHEAMDVGAAARLSLSLPVRFERYPSRLGANRWVVSVLPESHIRDRMAREFRIAPGDHSGMLLRVGRDIAGAAVIVPQGEPELAEHAKVEPATTSDVVQLIEQLDWRPLGVDLTRGVRLSLAGVQDKLLLVRRSDEGWARPINGYPSTHIIKPTPSQFPGLATNELFCLSLASLCGFDTPEAWIERFESVDALVVRRYDRYPTESGTIERLHQEDFLSALGYSSIDKYEVDAERGSVGPSLRDFARLISDYLGRANLTWLLRIVAFNVLIGNADAHARNLSMLLLPDGRVKLAPLYDLVATRHYPELNSDLAQLINGHMSIDGCALEDLIAEADTWGVPERLATRQVTDVVTSALGSMTQAGQLVGDMGGDPAVVSELEDYIAARSDLLLH